MLNILSWIALRIGRYDEAREALEESILLNKSVGDRWGLGFAYRGLGLIAQTQGKHKQAVDMFRKSLSTLIEIGMGQDVVRVLAEMSRNVFVLGNDTEAQRGWRESLRIATETRGAFVALEALAGIAGLQARQGDKEQAMELLLIVSNHPASIQETRDRIAHLRTELETQLTGQQVKAVQEQARVKTFDAAVGEILKQI